MVLVRETELKLGELFNDGKIPGFIHLSVGQEATCVGVCASLNPDDTLSSTHRGHGHCIAKGVDPVGLIQEVLGHSEGICRGHGGSLHVADFSVGMLGANGIVGAGIPIALGSALAHKILSTGRVAVSIFGDGAMAEGVFYESVNLAALWKLPILFVCENNGWSEFSPTSSQFVGDLAKLSESFGVRHERVDGNNVSEVFLMARELVASLRDGQGPAVLECMTLRVRGHYEGDPQNYRKGVVDRLVADPLEHASAALASMSVSAELIEGVRNRSARAVQEAAAMAIKGTAPNYGDALGTVYLNASKQIG
jgi:pyruvate dehydrogenase E1 component alpha subunit